MSQRVQKGNTVFRPVAKPRPRPVGDSRQPSALPESSNAQSSNNAPEALPTGGVVSEMGPPMPKSQRSVDAPPAQHAAQSTVTVMPDINPRTQEATNSYHNAAFDSNATSLTQASAPRAPPTLARLPPRINSSQPPSQSGTPISMPTRTMVRAPPRPPNIAPSVPTLPPTVAGPSHQLTEPSFPPPPPPVVMEAYPPSGPIPIDSSQIDPQLMGPSGMPGMTFQPIPEVVQATGGDPRPAVGLSEVPPVKIPRSRRAPRGRGVNDTQSGREADSQSGAEAGDAPAKKRRSKKTTAEGQENEPEATTKKRKRSETSEPRRSRKRAPSPPPFDPEADPGEELDPTAVTMAALCDDTGRGRVSSKAAQVVSNHAAWRAANREKRARLKAIMEAKKYGRNIEDDEEGANQSASNNAASSQQNEAGSASRAASVALDPAASTSANDTSEVEKGADGFDYSEDLAVSRFSVQVRIGANGETIIDEESLFVNRDEGDHTEEYTHVEESDFTKFVNSATYSKKLRGSRWSAEETEMFYDALSQFGENYELISYVLPGRDRKACKNKFKAEDRKNPARITYCLKNRRPYDIATLSRMTGKDFSGPTPEIRAPTPLRSTELQIDAEPTSPPPPPTIRKKSRTPSVHEAGVEIVGDIDDIGKDDFDDIGQDVIQTQA
ncbi:hypothetical protein C8Q73DRAFT_756033 [Cubamyces lactineus]|nr:hypothetical protein C8Q73DRAFT_756033 [Cubamyces lactineus]